MSIEFLFWPLATYGFTRGSAKAENGERKAAGLTRLVSGRVGRLAHWQVRCFAMAIKCAVLTSAARKSAGRNMLAAKGLRRQVEYAHTLGAVQQTQRQSVDQCKPIRSRLTLARPMTRSERGCTNTTNDTFARATEPAAE